MIETPLFSNNLIRLTEIDLEKDPQVESGWTYDPFYAIHYRSQVPGPLTVGELKKAHEGFLKNMEDKGTIYPFALRLPEQDRLIGFLRVESQVWAYRSLQISLAIGDPALDRKTYTQAALSLGIAFAFDELNAYRLSLKLPSQDVDMIHWAEAAGFQLEVRQRQACFMNNQLGDWLLFGLLADERKQNEVNQ